MSSLQLSLSMQPPAAPWSEKGLISIAGDHAQIHLNNQGDLYRQIKKAARQLDSLGFAAVQLSGVWTLHQQWAFASAFRAHGKDQTIHWCDNQDQQALEQRWQALNFTRDLINASAEEIYPESLAKRVTDWLGDIGDIQWRTWIGEELTDAGWAGTYQVGRGSERPPVLLEVDVNPTGDANASVAAALVGKGITFDSGGYSMKSSEGMLTMKCDMGGAATVAGGLGLAMLQGLNKRVKLFLCCAENLVSGHAYKLGDIITYKNGTRVEIVNTDAEGRLVLADGLIAAGETGAPLIVNAATLTGAAQTAVGTDFNALFSLDDQLSDEVLSLAAETNEPLWRLPLMPWHQEKCPSAFADTANSRAQKGGGAGGASNAAGFLSRFVPNDGKGWVHLDLAAAYQGNGSDIDPVGASGMGILTIAALLQR